MTFDGSFALFLDTSALLRAHLTKDQFQVRVQTAIAQAEPVGVSGLAHPELVAALTSANTVTLPDGWGRAQSAPC